MTGEEIKEETFECSHCEAIGEISFSCLKSQHRNDPVKVWVNNLPSGISKSGISNLFLTVGNPLNVYFVPNTNSASVTFGSMSEAELSVRDLDGKPPYNLKISISTPKSLKKPVTEDKETWDFSEQKNLEPKNDTSNKKLEVEQTKKIKDINEQVANVLGNIGYDPSIRMRQRKLDFKTDVECVSLGRGYTYMGSSDRFVGGLQKFKFSSENSKAESHMNFSCENCNASTTKICGRCSASFCSKICLQQSNVDHRKDCTSIRNKEEITPKISGTVDLISGCTVVMTVYKTMNIVFVRQSDDFWENKFTKLCNDVAVEALKGKSLEEMPEVNDLVLAMYYEDLCFYRAKVLSLVKDKINVFFIDFGNSQLTNIGDLKYFPDSLEVEPAQAVEVYLKDVEPKSSIESVDYFNKLTAGKTALTLKFSKTKKEVILIEKESKVVVNDTVNKLTMASWKRDSSIISKLGEIYYLESIKQQNLEVGKTFNPIISHFDEKEFLQSEVFWVSNPETDVFFHTNSEMYLKIKEYCEFLQNDFYLPRDNELCLAKEGGEWHRCVSLKSQKTTCYLFFLDDGHSSFIETSDIRKIIADFVEAPAQAICCTLPDNPKLKDDKEIQAKVIKYLNQSLGQTIQGVKVVKLMGDAFCLSLPEINNILAKDS